MKEKTVDIFNQLNGLLKQACKTECFVYTALQKQVCVVQFVCNRTALAIRLDHPKSYYDGYS